MITPEQRGKLTEILSNRIGDEAVKTLEALEPLLSEVRVNKVIARHIYFEFRKQKADDGGNYGHNEAVRMCADELGVSDSYVNKCVYRYRIGGIWD